MALNNFDEDQFDQENLGGDEYTPEPRKPRKNRTFLVVIGIIGILFIIALILLLLVAPGLLEKQRAAQLEQAARINANNTATALAATVQAQQLTAMAVTNTPYVAPSGGTSPTKTPVVVIIRSTNTPMASGGSGLSASELATVSALQTLMAAGAAGTPTPSSTALPTTGFADEVGLPMMAGLAIVLVAVIIMSRRLRLNQR
jgi:hypothetical protein